MNDTLEAAKEHLKMNVREGVRCPCCERFVKIYRRKLNSGMAKMAIHIYRTALKGDPRRWLSIEEICRALSPNSNVRLSLTGDYAKLRYWGLIEQQSDKMPGEPSSGNWRMTNKGFHFVMNRLTVPSHALVFNGELIQLEGDMVSIQQCLGRHFNYYELMGS